MTVTITAEAENDFEAIARFIGNNNPARAISFVQELVASCHSLADRPLRHPIVADYGNACGDFPTRATPSTTKSSAQERS